MAESKKRAGRNTDASRKQGREYAARRRAEDPDACNKKARENRERYKAKDPEGYLKMRREMVARCRAKDPEGYRKRRRESDARCRARDPEAYAKKKRAFLDRYKEQNPKGRSRTERSSDLKRRYGITVDDYEAVLKRQDGRCAICHNPPKSSKRLAVDHDHDTGTVRGLLCENCNRGLGLYGDSAAVCRAAADYLDMHSQVTSTESRGFAAF